jgi:cell division transport system ATP-binding protein
LFLPKKQERKIFLINIEHVSKVYPNGSAGVRDISIHIEKGEFVFFVGSSGSGKSTLIKLLLKELDPTEGKITINNVVTNDLPREKVPYLRRNLGVVFQDFRLLPNKTVYENVAFAMQVIEAPSKQIRRNVPAVLSLVGLAKKSRSYPNQLSGGEQQRTALARAIVNNPPILICDEPTGNLDPSTAWDIMDLLEDINRRGTTVVMATHAKDIVDMMQKRVVTLRRGQVIRDIQKGGYGDETEFN